MVKCNPVRLHGKLPTPPLKILRMQLFCLQLEASCLQLSFFAYNCVWELFCLQLELLLTIRAFLLTIEPLCLQPECVSKIHLNRL